MSFYNISSQKAPCLAYNPSIRNTNGKTKPKNSAKDPSKLGTTKTFTDHQIATPKEALTFLYVEFIDKL